MIKFNLLILLLLWSSSAFCQQGIGETGRFPGGNSLEGFGGNFSVSGDYLIAGSEAASRSLVTPGGMKGGDMAGFASIMKKNQTTGQWTFLLDLLASDLNVYDFFGGSTSLSGDLALVGASGNDDMGAQSGSAYIFSKNLGGADKWGELKKILPSDGQGNDRFGSSTSLDGDWALISSVQDGDLGSNSGSAYIFNRNTGGSNNWGQVVKLLPPDGTTDTGFGQKVLISGNIAFISSLKGAVYIFYKDQGGAGNWGFVTKIVSPDVSNFFGLSISASGDMLAVGTASQSAFIFKKDQGDIDQWGLEKKIVSSNTQPNDWFGTTVSIMDTELFVGAQNFDGYESNSGAVYWYSQDTGGPNNWGEVKQINGSLSNQGSGFGETLITANNTLFVLSKMEGSFYTFNFFDAATDNHPLFAGAASVVNVNDNVTVKPFGALSVSDSDVPAQLLTLTIKTDNGSVGGFSTEITKRNASTYTFSGTASQVNTVLHQVVFTPIANLTAPGQSTSVNFTLTIDDGMFSATQDIEIKIMSVNNPPVIPDASVELDYRKPVGEVVASVPATDPDLGQKLTYVITSGNEDDAFTIDQSGKIKLKTSPLSPFGKSHYALSVAVSDDDATPLGATSSVTIDLIDENFYKVESNAQPTGQTNSFGNHTAIDGTISAVSDEAGNSVGTVSIFYKMAGTWSLIKTIMPPVSNTGFGCSVAIKDDLLFVGASKDNDIAVFSGAVYIYKKDLGGQDTWGLFKKLKAPDAANGDLFGGAVAVANDLLLIGSKADDDGAINAGSAYLFERNTGGSDNWGMINKLVATDPQIADGFGEILDMSEGYAIITAPGDDDGGSNSGSAYFFKIDPNGAWHQEAKITSHFNGLGLGYSIRPSVSSSGFAAIGFNSKVFVYERTGVIWTLQKAFNKGSFGSAVKFTGDIFAVSDDWKDFIRRVSVFKKDWGGTGNWGMVYAVPSSSVKSISVTENDMVLGSPDFSSSTGKGTVQFYNRSQAIVLQDQTIIFDPFNNTVTYGSQNILLTATGGGSANPILFTSSNAAVAEIVNNSEIRIIGAGTATITASQAGNINYAAAPDVSQPLTVVKADQQITFNPLPEVYLGSPSFQANASATSNLPVELYSANTDVATVFENVITIVGLGETVITASQPGNENFNAASTIQQTLQVSLHPVGLHMKHMKSRRSNEVSIPITVSSFKEILGAQFSIVWDKKVITYVDVENFSLAGIDNNSFGTSAVHDGKLTFLWTDPALIGQTLSDSSTLFNIRFKLTGEYGGTTDVSASDQPAAIELITKNYEVIPVQTKKGKISIDGDLPLSGRLLYSNNEPVLNVSLNITGFQNKSYTNNNDGGFLFNLQPEKPEDLFIITPQKLNDPEPLNGIDVQDVATIRRHILQTQLLHNPFQIIAADYNSNKTVSVLDLALIQSLILKISPGSPAQLWTFIPADYTFPDESNPFPYPVDKTFRASILESSSQVDFIAVKHGDVNQSRDNSQDSRTKELREIIFDIRQEIVTSKEESTEIIEIPVRVVDFNDISAYQFTVSWDPYKLEFIEVSNMETKSTYGKRILEEGKLAVIWDDENAQSVNLTKGAEIFILRFKRLNNGTFRDVNITNELIPAKVFDGSLTQIQYSVSWSELSQEDNEASIYPNPFENELNIEFFTAEKEEAHISIADVTGKNIWEDVIISNEGKNKTIWNGVNNSYAAAKSGIYILTLRTTTKTKIVKLVKK